MIGNVIVYYQHEDDVGMLNELIRAYIPGVNIENKCEMIPKVRGVENSLPLVDDGILKLEEDASLVKIVFFIKNKVYEQQEELCSPGFSEEKKNRRRRLFRLAFHKIILQLLKEEVLPGRISPWGGLTGVRPTKIAHRLLNEGFSKERVLKHLTRDYGMSEKKAQLLTEIAIIQKPYLLTDEEARKLVGIYIGIPFCPTRCHYCSFPAYSLTRWGKYLNEYLIGLAKEIEEIGKYLKKNGIKVHSVYLGGGTPTILTKEQIDELFSKINLYFDMSKDVEITVEGGRPDTLDTEKMLMLKKWGIRRLSINPQTMHDKTLKEVGRNHSAQEVVETYKLAREINIPVINMDLIIGLPGEDRYMVKETLEEVLALSPENITLHALAIKRAAKFNQEGFSKTSFSEGQIMMELAQNTLEQAEYLPYYLYRQKNIMAHGENVGYTLKGYQSVYNILMMEERQTILGLGVGASSKFVQAGQWSVESLYNPKDILIYLSRLEELIQRKVDKLNSFVYNNF